LDSRFSNSFVRAHAVKCLSAASDSELRNFLLQLVHAVKYEPYHDSPLARFLLARALQNYHLIGQQLFWHMKSEMHLPEIAPRYGLLLESFLRGVGSDVIMELLQQQEVQSKLHTIAAAFKQKRFEI